MKTDSEIKISGPEILNRHPKIVEAERFTALIQRDKFDHTKCRESLFDGLSGEKISRRAMEHQKHIKGE